MIQTLHVGSTVAQNNDNVKCQFHCCCCSCCKSTSRLNGLSEGTVAGLELTLSTVRLPLTFPFLALRFDHRCHGAETGLSCSLFAQSECSTTVRYAMPPQCAVSHVMTSSLRAALPPVIWCPLLHQTEVSTRLLVHFAPNRNKHLFSFRVTSDSMHSFSYSFYADLK